MGMDVHVHMIIAVRIRLIAEGHLPAIPTQRKMKRLVLKPPTDNWAIMDAMTKKTGRILSYKAVASRHGDTERSEREEGNLNRYNR